MKFLVVLVLAVASATAADPEYAAPIIRYNYEISPNGDFQHGYESGNGIYNEAQGVLKNTGAEHPFVAISGSYKYTAPGGEVVEVAYTADEDGFKPVGSHIPVPPPIPEAIARSLAYIQAHPSPKEVPKAITASLLG